MNQQTNKDVLDLLNRGGKVTINLTGVSFENRQEVIKSMMESNSPRGITLHTEINNQYDKFAISVRNHAGDTIGYIPKQKSFSVVLPSRRRPIPFGKYVVNMVGKSMQTNEIFYNDIQENLYTGKILKYHAYGSDNKTPIGVTIQFQKA